MGDLSTHFSRSEFACKCGCGFDTVDTEMLGVLEDLRAMFKEPIAITSGCRCAEHNAKEGGSPRSQHVYGRAVDLVVRNVSPDRVCNYLTAKHGDKYGIGLYGGWVHFDTRTGCARWQA